jgi:hypothetical protein
LLLLVGRTSLSLAGLLAALLVAGCLITKAWGPGGLLLIVVGELRAAAGCAAGDCKRIVQGLLLLPGIAAHTDQRRCTCTSSIHLLHNHHTCACARLLL